MDSLIVTEADMGNERDMVEQASPLNAGACWVEVTPRNAW
jgi:hypothetical protein